MKLRMRSPIPRVARTVALATAFACVPCAVHAQGRGLPPSTGQEFIGSGPQFLGGLNSSVGDRYLLGTVALGIPSALVSAGNLKEGAAGGVWMGLAGIGLGVGHGALFVAGLREEESLSGATVWWNAAASAYSTISGILQIRSTIGDGPDSSSIRATVTPRVDGLRLRVTWKR